VHSTDSESEDRGSVVRPQSQHSNEAREIDTDEEEDDDDGQTRVNNAYPGSTNSIGSVHQRNWFMLLDRVSSGFVQDAGTGKWVGKSEEQGQGFVPFFVRGRDYERSVVTGRVAREVEKNDNVANFKGRNGWVAVMH
jgi:hypothetical protein